tara:strand:+ start:2316 stop:2894 length:579 start_codon:yes stop_codon:yes gene_type:complete
MEPKSIISITLLGIISACLVAMKAFPQTENYGFHGGDVPNPQGIHPLGDTNNNNVHVGDGNHQLMDEHASNHPWTYTKRHQRRSNNKGSKDVYVPAKSKCELCNDIKMRIEHHDKALEELNHIDGLKSNDAALKTMRIDVNNSFMKSTVGNGTYDYIRGDVDVCVKPHTSFTSQQLTGPLKNKVSYMHSQMQ